MRGRGLESVQPLFLGTSHHPAAPSTLIQVDPENVKVDQGVSSHFYNLLLPSGAEDSSRRY
jgi:hypothetical protein